GRSDGVATAIVPVGPAFVSLGPEFCRRPTAGGRAHELRGRCVASPRLCRSRSQAGGRTALLIRRLRHDEIDTIWTIDRSEVIHRIYRLRQGVLVSKPAYCEASGWPPGEVEKVTPSLHACYRRGGGFSGMFEGGVLVGAAVIDGEGIGPDRDWIALKFLYVS